ncbi:MAG: thioredoxin [Clostridia bacterium]|nr:thioredoxin [Clostridiales bacterium]MBQ6716575.1 thioredoxin [Clostridia bacterium]
MAIVNANKNNFKNEVLLSDKPVLLDFWAPWCGPCRMVGPILEQIAAERGDVKVVKVNVDEETELAREYGIMSIPTIMVVREGKVVNQSLGAKPKNQILNML